LIVGKRAPDLMETQGAKEIPAHIGLPPGSSGSEQRPLRQSFESGVGQKKRAIVGRLRDALGHSTGVVMVPRYGVHQRAASVCSLPDSHRPSPERLQRGGVAPWHAHLVRRAVSRSCHSGLGDAEFVDRFFDGGLSVRCLDLADLDGECRLDSRDRPCAGCLVPLAMAQI
jgi:hypothetical protein